MRAYSALERGMALNRLLMLFQESLRRVFSKQSEVPDEVSPHEVTARFLLEPGHFRRDNGHAKPKAFQPARRDNRTSVFRTRDLLDSAVWELADRYVAAVRGQPVIARAELTVVEITAVGLMVEPDRDPPRHANITGWPSAKDEWKSLAQELAAKARLRVR
jgi:hypothetical protein